jgi:hypothetical protein
MPNRPYKTDLSDGAWALVVPLLPAARPVDPLLLLLLIAFFIFPFWRRLYRKH